MLSTVVFALLLTLSLGSPVPQRDADWKERLTGLSRQNQDVPDTPAVDGEEVQPQPLADPEATDHSAVQVSQEKQAVNWWEKDHQNEPAAVHAVHAGAAATEADEAAPAVLNAEESVPVVQPAVAVPLPAAVAEVQPAEEEEVQKVSQTDVEATWNKEPARQEKEPAEQKPWWETDASSSSAAPPAQDAVEREEGSAPIPVEPEVPAAVEPVVVVPEEAAEEAAAAAHRSEKVRPLKPHHSSVNEPVRANNNDDEE